MFSFVAVGSNFISMLVLILRSLEIYI